MVSYYSLIQHSPSMVPSHPETNNLLPHENQQKYIDAHFFYTKLKIASVSQLGFKLRTRKT